MTPTFTLSLLAHNELQLTRRCLASIVPDLSPEIQLILTDNGSNDGTKEFFERYKADHPEFSVGINLMGYNAGFIAAHNKACEFALGKYFVVLNNDIDFLRTGWLERIRNEFLLDPKLAIVGASGNCNTLGPSGRGFLSNSDPEYIEGSILAIRTSLAKQYGLFGKEYRFGYCEDADLSLRLQERGWKIKTINIPHIHERFKTYENTKTEIDLEGFDSINHMKFGQRWSYFLKNRHFKYRIALRRSGARGDVLLATPVIRALRKRFGHAEIDFFTDHPEMMYRNPDIRYTYSGLQKEQLFQSSNYEVCFDLDQSYESDPKKHIVTAYADKCNLECNDFKPVVFPSPNDRLMACGMVNGNSGRPLAAIHCGPTAWDGRNWSLNKFSEVGHWLRAKGWEIVLVGNGLDHKIDCNYDARGKTSVHELASVIERCGLFVGLDSLPMHLAACAMVPTVAMFGCIDPKYRVMPWSFVKGVVAENVSCLGCHHEWLGPRNRCDCLRPRVECMDRLSVDRVTEAIEEVLRKKMISLETSKIRQRVMPFIKGSVIDLGCSRDPIEPDCVAADKDPWPEVNCVVDIAGPLPFPDENFGTVYSSHALEDQDDPAGVLREWVRILKRGGNLILYVPHKVLYPATGMSNLDHKVDGFLPEELVEMVEPLGFTTILNEVDDGDDRYSCLFVAEKTS